MPLDGDVPQKLWTRVFGFLAYMHIARDQRSKLDKKTKPCIFLGYPKDEFRYRLSDWIEKVVRSRDIVFMEDKTIEDWKQ